MKIKLVCVFTVVFVFIFSIFHCSQVFSQAENIQFDHISIEQGLSQSSVLCIIQDVHGFMWFGSHDGLNRFDGYGFVIHKNDKSNTKTIGSNIILTLYRTKDEQLWIGTNGGGLSVYNPDNESFINYSHESANHQSISNNVVRTILETTNGEFWIGTDAGGLNKFDRKSGKAMHYKNILNNQNSLSNNKINALCEDKFGNIWIGTDDGLNILNPKTEKFLRIFHNNQTNNTISSNTISCILKTKNGEIWIGTTNGLNLYNEASQTFANFLKNENVNSICHNTITALFEDSNGMIWVGTSDGLSIYNPKSQKFYSYKHHSYNSKTIGHNNIASIYEDKSGIMWIGSWERGLSKYDKNLYKFKHYVNNPENPNSLPNKTVRSVFEDKDGSLWIGLIGEGLVHFDRQQTKQQKYQKNSTKKNSLQDNSVTSIYRDSYNNLWIGTWSHGLSKAVFKKNTKNTFEDEIIGFEHFNYQPENQKSLSNNSIQKIFEDSKQRLWIGTANGMNIFDLKTGKNYRLSSIIGDKNSGKIQSIQAAIAEDYQGNIWYGTWDGLFCVSLSEDFSSTQIAEYIHNQNDTNSISDNRIISLLIDKNNIVWAGTFGSGLNKIFFHDSKLGVKSYTETDGLSNNVIYAIHSDESGNLWLSTNRGISKFNPQTETFINFDESDGLQSMEFFWGASWKSKTGEIFFGGINGLNAFFPENIKSSDFLPSIVITDFKIFNQHVPIGENSILKKSILVTNELQLTYKDKIIQFEFASLHFSSPEKNKYEYKLQGFNDKWIQTDYSKRFAVFTNLDAGEYIFKVRGSNSDNVWNKTGLEIKIKIKPPYWETWWFRILIIVILIIIIAIFVTARINRIKFQKMLLEKQVEERTREIQQKNLILNQQKEEISAQAEELKATNEELEKLSIVASETDNAVIIMDACGNMQWINAGFTRLFGYHFEEYICDRGVNMIQASNSPYIEKLFRNLLESKKSVTYENQALTRIGEKIWLQTTLTPILNANGEITKIIAIDAEITKIKEAELLILQQNTEIKFQNENIKKSIKYAKTIQQAILPLSTELDSYFEHFIIFQPKDIVSGDFYWFSHFPPTETTNELVFIAVIDCTGHGVPGAFMSLIGNRILNEIVNEKKILSPAEILKTLNINIKNALNQEQTNNDDGMEMAMCRIDYQSNGYALTFSGAKEDIFIKQQDNDSVIKLKGDRLAIGGRQSINSKIEFTNQIINIQAGDIIYLISDGILDLNNDQRKRFSRKRFMELLQKIHNHELEKQKQLIELEINNWLQKSEQRDDITIIGIKIRQNMR